MIIEKPIQIFIAYSRKDKDVLSELRIHLKVLERIQNVKVWYDGLIEAGENWEDSIKDNLQAADIILLLVSQYFLASDYCYNKEMKQALALHDEGKVRTVPIIVRECLWKKTQFAQLQALPQDGKPINHSNRELANHAYMEIVGELEAMVIDINHQKQKLLNPHTNIKAPLKKMGTEDTSANFFIDPRDGQAYKTVEILGKTWFAKNLNFDVGKGCWFYNENPKIGEKYGRLYTWEAAKKACPPGWRLPTKEEFLALIKYFGGHKRAYETLLKDGHSGFEVLLGGYRNINGNFFNLDRCGFHWSSTKRDNEDDKRAWGFNFFGGTKVINQDLYEDVSQGFSCRYIKE